MAFEVCPEVEVLSWHEKPQPELTHTFMQGDSGRTWNKAAVRWPGALCSIWKDKSTLLLQQQAEIMKQHPGFWGRFTLMGTDEIIPRVSGPDFQWSIAYMG